MSRDGHGFLSSVPFAMARVLLAVGSYYLFTLTWPDLPSAVAAVVLWADFSIGERP